jgi:hypothetical protein
MPPITSAAAFGIAGVAALGIDATIPIEPPDAKSEQRTCPNSIL